MRLPSSTLPLLGLFTLAGCAASEPSSATGAAMLAEAADDAPAVPQAPLVTCIDPRNPEVKAIITVTNDLDLSWDMFGVRGTSALVGAGFSWGDPSEPTMLNVLLRNGRRMVVRGDYEEESLVSIDAPEGHFECGPGSRMKAYNIRNILEVTNRSFEKRAELARCDFGGVTSSLWVRPALRGAGAIVEGTAPVAGRFHLVAGLDATGKGGVTLTGEGATLGDPAGAALPFSALTVGADTVASDASPERAFPANTCRVFGLDYARRLIAGEHL